MVDSFRVGIERCLGCKSSHVLGNRNPLYAPVWGRRCARRAHVLVNSIMVVVFHTVLDTLAQKLRGVRQKSLYSTPRWLLMSPGWCHRLNKFSCLLLELLIRSGVKE